MTPDRHADWGNRKAGQIEPFKSVEVPLPATPAPQDETPPMTNPAHVDVAELRAVNAHVRVSTAGMAGESRPGFWMCKCGVYDHAPGGEQFAYDREAHHRAHVAAMVERAVMDELEELRAKVAAVEALADEWDSDEWCDSDVTYGSVASDLRAALESTP